MKQPAAPFDTNWHFPEPALREAILAAVPAPELEMMHEHVQAVLEALASGDACIARDLSRHAAEAARARTRTHTIPKADVVAQTELRYMHAAAEDADRHFQVQDAARLWLDVARHRLTTPTQRIHAFQRAAEALRHAGRLDEAKVSLDRALELTDPGHDTTRIRLGRATLLRMQGAHAAAEVEARAVLETASDEATRGEALTCLAGIQRDTGDIRAATATFETALEVLRAHPDPLAAAKAAGALATLFAQTGHPDRAELLYRQAMEAHREGKDPRGEAIYAGNLSTVLRELGRADEAEALCRRALETHRALGNRADEALCQGNLAILLKATGRPQEAELAYRRALHIFREQGNHAMEGQYLVNLANLLDDTGRTVQAIGCYENALLILGRGGLRRPLAFAQGNLAVARQKLGLVDQAMESFDAAIAQLADLGAAVTVAAFQCLRGELRLLLGDESGAQADAEAAATSLSGDSTRVQKLTYLLPLQVRLLVQQGRADRAQQALEVARSDAANARPGAEFQRTLDELSELVSAATLGAHFNGHLPAKLSRELRRVLATRAPDSAALLA